MYGLRWFVLRGFLDLSLLGVLEGGLVFNRGWSRRVGWWFERSFCVSDL